MSWTRKRIVALGFPLLSAVACAGEGSRQGERTGSSAHAIVNGVESPADHDFVVQLAYLKRGARVAHCSGTVVAKRLILTARHCVGEVSVDDSNVTDYDPSILHVFVGRDASKRVLEEERAPAAKGKKLFVPPTKYLIPDIAIIMTDVD